MSGSHPVHILSEPGLHCPIGVLAGGIDGAKRTQPGGAGEILGYNRGGMDALGRDEHWSSGSGRVMGGFQVHEV